MAMDIWFSWGKKNSEEVAALVQLWIESRNTLLDLIDDQRKHIIDDIVRIEVGVI